MFQILILAGAAGGALLYAIQPSSWDQRGKNAGGLLFAILIGLALWQAGVAAAWSFPGGWCAAFVLLWASTYQVGPDDLVWVRTLATIGLIDLMVQIFR